MMKNNVNSDNLLKKIEELLPCKKGDVLYCLLEINGVPCKVEKRTVCSISEIIKLLESKKIEEKVFFTEEDALKKIEEIEQLYAPGKKVSLNSEFYGMRYYRAGEIGEIVKKDALSDGWYCVKFDDWTYSLKAYKFTPLEMHDKAQEQDDKNQDYDDF